MSSSGLIYAFIVGAWAVYLVPMWLRREDELNKARQTQRYTTAIKVLSHKDSFERRYEAAAEQEERGSDRDSGRGRDRDQRRPAELPVAAGQSGVAPQAGQRTLERVKAKERERETGRALWRPTGEAEAEPAAGKSAKSAGPAKSSASSAASARPARPTAKTAVPAASSTSKTVSAAVGAGTGPAAKPSRPGAGNAPGSSSGSASASSGLMARRRRVVGALFALTTFGALVSADLGLKFVFAMLIPAAVLSAYIVWVRKDERTRAAERARRRAAAARAAREAEAKRREREATTAALAETLPVAGAPRSSALARGADRSRDVERERARREREEQARRAAAARRRAAAARSRAERRTATPPSAAAGHAPAPVDPDELPRAAGS